MNDEAVCRTAPATPGLLNMGYPLLNTAPAVVALPSTHFGDLIRPYRGRSAAPGQQKMYLHEIYSIHFLICNSMNFKETRQGCLVGG